MIKYLFQSILRRRERSALIIIGVTLFSAAYIIFASASSQVTVTSDAALNQYWRTTYDILVRHPDYVTDIEKEYGLVEANHLNGTPGGISFEQYETILNIENIEVAAPIAMLGYINKEDIWFSILDEFPKGIYQVTMSSQITDGYGQYDMTLPGPFWYTFDHLPDYSQYERRIENMERLNIYNSGNTDATGFILKLPKFDDQILIAAIDPKQEAQLIHIDNMLIEGRYLPEHTDVFYSKFNWPIVPVLINVQDYIQQTVTIKIEHLALEAFDDPDKPFLESLEEVSGPEKLAATPLTTVWEYTLPIKREFNRISLRVYISEGEFVENPWNIRNGQYDGFLLAPDAVEYEIENNAPFLNSLESLVLKTVPIGTSTTEQGMSQLYNGLEVPQFYLDQQEVNEWRRSPEVLFRETVRRHDGYAVFDAQFQGVFKVDEQIALGEMSPNQVPLETYRPPLVTLRYDEEGNPLPETTLSPTLNYFGYLSAPPDALIRLSDAYAILEHGCVEIIPDEQEGLKPQQVHCPETDTNIISAIRVRVAGIDELTPENQAKIELVAQEIYERTGLHVDIMVGSSPQPVLVHVPGYEDVPGLGYVEEYWVKKGVTTLLLSGLNRADQLLFGAMLVVCLLFLFNFNYVSVLGRMEEFAMLLSLGWRRRSIFGFILSEAALIGLVSGAISALITLVVINLYGLDLPQTSVLVIIPLGGAVYLLGNLLPAWEAARTPALQVIKTGETKQAKRVPGGNGLFSYAFGGLFRRPSRTIASLLGVGVASAFLVILQITISGLDGQLYGTILGEWIRTQIQPFHLMMGIIALVVSAMGVGLIMILNYVSRRKEIGLLLAFGWQRKYLFRVFIIESGLLGLLGGVLGTTIAFMVTVQNNSLDLSTLDWVQPLIIGVGLPVLVSILATYYPALNATRIAPVEAFRGEVQVEKDSAKSSGIVGFVLISSVVILILLSVFWQTGLQPSDEIASNNGSDAVLASPTATLGAAPPPFPTPTPVSIFRLTSYEMHLAPDLENKRISGQETIQVTNKTSDSWDTIALVLHANQLRYRNNDINNPPQLEIETVRLDGQPANYQINDESTLLTIYIDDLLLPGQEAVIEIAFENDLRYTETDFGEIIDMSFFYPILAVRSEDGWETNLCDMCSNNTYSESANYTYSIDLPDNWLVAASGELVNIESNGEGIEIHTFTAEAVREITWAASPDFVETAIMIEDIPITIYTLAGNIDFKDVQSELEVIFPILTQILGPYPFDTLDVIAMGRDRNSGKARPGVVYVNRSGEKPDEAVYLLSQHLAHQWWGDSLEIDQFSHAWMLDSLLRYTALLVMEETGHNEYLEPVLAKLETDYKLLVSSGREIYLDADAPEYERDINLFLDVTRTMGIAFFKTLHETIGDEAFFAGLQELTSRYQYGIITPNDLLEVFQQTSGYDLSNLFATWGAIIP